MPERKMACVDAWVCNVSCWIMFRQELLRRQLEDLTKLRTVCLKAAIAPHRAKTGRVGDPAIR
jgi:hypothetical protein